MLRAATQQTLRGTAWEVAAAIEVWQKEHERAMHEGEKISAWKIESSWPQAAPEHAAVGTLVPRTVRPSRSGPVPAASTVGSLTGPHDRAFLANGD